MYKVDDILAFIAHPRTGSRSTRELLSAHGATKHAGHHQVDEPILRNLLTKGGNGFCTVRNMFDLLVSWYYNSYYNAQGDVLNESIVVPPFDYYIQETIRNPKHRWFMTPIYHYGLPWCKYQIRYERLQDGADLMMDMIGQPRTELPYIGKSIGRDPDYRVYYSEATRKAVEKRWAQDLYLTNYDFNGPKQ